MRVIKSIFKGISGFFLILSLSMSFAPPTEREARALGPDYTRREIVQVRMATGALMLDQFGVLERFADYQEVPADALRIVLTDISNGKPPQTQTALQETTEAPFDDSSQRGINGPRFITVN